MPELRRAMGRARTQWPDPYLSDRGVGATPFFQEFFAIVGEVAAEPPQINLTRMITEKE